MSHCGPRENLPDQTGRYDGMEADLANPGTYNENQDTYNFRHACKTGYLGINVNGPLLTCLPACLLILFTEWLEGEKIPCTYGVP